jgi:hypothetical protein
MVPAAPEGGTVKRAAVAVLATLLAAVAHGEATHVILSGSGGDEAYSARFADWGARLRAALLTYSQVDESRVTWLSEAPTPESAACTAESIGEVFRGLSQTLAPQDELYVYFIGHGSHRAGVSKFNVPGPDPGAEEFDALLDALPAGRICVINGTSASAGFVNVLSGPGRVLCTATKSVEERNATQFMGFLVEALETGAGDLDRDGRISVLEACAQAASLTEAWYANTGLIQTEHAILDDDGDGLGSRLPLEEEASDGNAARMCYIRDFAYGPETPRELVAAYEEAIAAVDALKAQKESLEEAEYYGRLESLLIEAARAHRALREATPQDAEAGR